jgi:hypothetical protein
VLVMFPLCCSLPCLRGVLEFAPSVSNVLIILSTSMSSWSARVGFHEDMEVDKIMRTFLTLGANSNTPRRHGSGKNNENVLVMFSLFCPLPCLRGVLEFVPSVSNVLIILSTSMSSWNARVCH